MKKILAIILALTLLFTLTACGGNKASESADESNKTSQKEKKKKKEKEEEKEEESNKDKDKEKEDNKDEIDDRDDIIIDDDENIEFDDEDNKPPEAPVKVEKVINCDGCVFAYFSDEGDKAKTIGSTLSPSEYTTDITTLKTMGSKQRHNFFGLVLSGDKITKAYACILKDNKIYCIQGSTNGAYHNANIAILNQIFTADQCKTISAGHTYTCTDGHYNGDTKTTGYTSLHYETSCVIYGSESNTGKLICH